MIRKPEPKIDASGVTDARSTSRRCGVWAADARRELIAGGYRGAVALTWGWGGEGRRRRLRRLSPDQRAELAELERRLSHGPDPEIAAFVRRLWWVTDFADPSNAARHAPLEDFPRNDELIAVIEED